MGWTKAAYNGEMHMTVSTALIRSSSLVLVIGAAALVGACRSNAPGGVPAAPSPNTLATVDGREITRDAVEKAYRREAAQQQRSEEEVAAAKLSLLIEMTVQEMLVGKAQELKIELSDTELDNAFNEAKKNITDEQFQKELAARNLTPADMRESLRRDLLVNKVIEREVTQKIVITDQDITQFYEANRAGFNRAEDAYHIAQITVTPVRANQQINRSGNDAGSPQEAQAKAQMLMERLKAGAPFAELAADFSEDPETSQRGGDLGFVPISALQKVPAPLRDAVINSQPGSVRMVSIGGGHTIVLVVARDTAGQKDPSMPAVKDTITSTLRGRREQLLRAAYINSLRNKANIVNYYADSLVQAQGKAAPSIAPSAPAPKK
jgi:peptidyl-prolyl cis-trans isomerase SurA